MDASKAQSFGEKQPNPAADRIGHDVNCSMEWHGPVLAVVKQRDQEQESLDFSVILQLLRRQSNAFFLASLLA
jgi:hypothetical protein